MMPKKPAPRLLVYTIWAISFTATIITHAEDAIFPPKELRAEWEEIQELKFADWSIKEFLGWDTPFDGGSKVFFFESDGGEKFELVIANPSYWTNKDKKERRQVFIIIHKNRFYRIEPKSDEQNNMINKLTDAANRLRGEGKKDPELLRTLADRLKSRKPVFKIKN